MTIVYRATSVFMATLLAIATSFALVGQLPSMAHAATKAKSITLYADSATKGTATLKASGLNAKKATWKSSKKRIATVAKGGKVTAKKAGTATITAKQGKKTYKFKLTVKNVSISKKKATLTVGKTLTLKLTGDKIKSAKSSAKKVATVSKTGKVAAKKSGTATITLTSKKGKKYTCKVTVKAKATNNKSGTSSSNSPTARIVAEGASGTCVWALDARGTLTIKPKAGGDGTLGIWSTSDGVPWHTHAESITSVKFDGKIKAQTCAYMFYGLAKANSIDLTGLDSSAATSMESMFGYCKSLTTLDVSNLNTASIEDMERVFESCVSLKSLNLSSWNVSNVSTMSYMFAYCELLKSLNTSGWETSSVEDMNGMFILCKSLTAIDASDWDTSNVMDMEDMFYDCKSINKVSTGTNWNYFSIEDGCMPTFPVAMTDQDGNGYDADTDMPEGAHIYTAI